MDVNLMLDTARFLQGAIPMGDGMPNRARADRRGELFVENLYNGLQGFSEEGSYYYGQTPTPGTAINMSVATGVAFADTQALFTLYNGEMQSTGANPGKRILLDFISFIVTTAPTTAGVWHLQHRIDSGNRYASGGTALTRTNVNMDVGVSPQGIVTAGVVTATASTANVRNVGRNVIRTVLANIGDQIIIKFGSQENAAGGVAVNTAAGVVITLFAPPVIIGPNQSYVCNEWQVGRTATGTGEFMCGWIER